MSYVITATHADRGSRSWMVSSPSRARAEVLEMLESMGHRASVPGTPADVLKNVAYEELVTKGAEVRLQNGALKIEPCALRGDRVSLAGIESADLKAIAGSMTTRTVLIALAHKFAHRGEHEREAALIDIMRLGSTQARRLCEETLHARALRSQSSVVWA